MYAVVTQRRHGNTAPHWVTSYHVSYENEIGKWTDIMDASGGSVVRNDSLNTENENVLIEIKSDNS